MDQVYAEKFLETAVEGLASINGTTDSCFGGAIPKR
jgi:hypothetical protein